MSDQHRDLQLTRISWRGIAITVTYEPNWLNLRDLVGTCAHLTVTADGRHPLPFTPTGFQSLFIAPAEVDDAGGPAALVAAWLDATAEGTEWTAQQAPLTQLELF